MGREIKGFICGALVSVGIHLTIFFLLIFTTPALLRVQAIPGSIAVSLGTGRHQPVPREKTAAQAIETKPTQQERETTRRWPFGQGSDLSPAADALTMAPGVEDGSRGINNPDSRGNSPQAIPRSGGNPKPLYPEIARRRGYEGTVRLAVEVLANGRVGGVRVKGSSGYAILDHSALKTVKEWRFDPARFAGIPVTSTVIVPITFQLKDNVKGHSAYKHQLSLAVES